MVEMIPVSSSNISAIGYDPQSQTLTVRFTSGGQYSYRGVPQEEFDDFQNAPSPGQFFASNIKGTYPYSKS